MADIPIPTTLPQRPVEKHALQSAQGEIALHEAQANLGLTLSKIGLGWYNRIKQNEAADQFAQAQAKTFNMASGYSQYVRENSDVPDTELAEFNRRWDEHKKDVDAILTNRQAQDEWNQWSARRKELLSDSAMEKAYNLNQGLKRAAYQSDLTALLNEPVPEILAPETLEKELEERKTDIRKLVEKANEGDYLTVEEQANTEALIAAYQSEIELDFAEAELNRLPSPEFEKAARTYPEELAQFSKDNEIDLKDQWFERAKDAVTQRNFEEQVVEQSRIDATVGAIDGLPLKDRMAEVNKLTGVTSVERNKIEARVQSQMDVEIERHELELSKLENEEALDSSNIISRGMPAGETRKWLKAVEDQYKEGPRETSDAARLAINNAIDAVAMGFLNNAGAMKVYNAHKADVRKDERSVFVKKIEEEKDKHYSYRQQVGLAMMAGPIKGQKNAVGVYEDATALEENQYNIAATRLGIELDERKELDQPLTRAELYAITAQIVNDIIEEAGPRREIEDEDFYRRTRVPPLGKFKKLVNPIKSEWLQGISPSGQPEALAANDRVVFEHIQALKKLRGANFPAAGEEYVKTQLNDLNDIWDSLNDVTKRDIIETLLEDPSISNAGKQIRNAIVSRRQQSK